MIVYKNNVQPHEVNYLRHSIGFRQIAEKQLQKGLSGSSYIVAAYDDELIIGMARLLWDGGSVALILDAIVKPSFEESSLKSDLIKRILIYLDKQLEEGEGIQVDIKAWDKDEKLLLNLGFKQSLIKYRGQPMHICLTNNIDKTDKHFMQCDFKK